MTQITEQFPYPQIKNKLTKYNRKVTVTTEEGRLITEWCTNPQRLKEDIEKIKKNLGI